MKRNQLRILRTLSLAFIALLCLSLPAYADMGPKPDLTVTVVNAPEGLCYVDLLYEGGGDDLHSDFDTSGCDQKLIASLHTLEGDGWTLALTTGISSGPPIFGDLTPNSDGAYHYSYYGLPGMFRLAVATEKGAQATQESYTRTRFHTNLVYDWNTNTLSYVTPSPLYYTAQFLATFLPTLAIEGDHPVAVQVPAKADLADFLAGQLCHPAGIALILQPVPEGGDCGILRQSLLLLFYISNPGDHHPAGGDVRLLLFS